MSQNWPAGVNQNAMHPRGYREGSTIIVEENDIGSPKTRQRTTGVPKYHNFDMAFAPAEWNLLTQWVRFNLKGGAETFMFPSPQTGQIVEMRLIVNESGWFSNYRDSAEERVITLNLEEQP
ncbi:MAG: hypothetical protein LBD46_04780 [Endomicrobium sp.]|jgi:hypothetical protein|nr:hypothetical protein [Endomicrobium sp.]